MGSAFVVLNPVAGHSEPRMIKKWLDQYMHAADWTYEVYQTTGEEDTTEVVLAAADRGFDLYVAAGGDGTVSAVAGAVIEAGGLLGIIPAGTGNALARDLEIPLDLEQAIALLVGPHAESDLDAMHVGQRYLILNLGLGISARTMSQTDRDAKQTVGGLAYLITGLQELANLTMYHLEIEVDGTPHRLRASEVLVLNSGGTGITSAQWAMPVRSDDGQLEIYAWRGRSLRGVLRFAWHWFRREVHADPEIMHWSATESIVIDSDPLADVEGDGEPLGETPVEIEVVPNAAQVIVPERAPDSVSVAGPGRIERQ